MCDNLFTDSLFESFGQFFDFFKMNFVQFVNVCSRSYVKSPNNHNSVLSLSLFLSCIHASTCTNMYIHIYPHTSAHYNSVHVIVIFTRKWIFPMCALYVYAHYICENTVPSFKVTRTSSKQVMRANFCFLSIGGVRELFPCIKLCFFSF